MSTSDLLRGTRTVPGELVVIQGCSWPGRPTLCWMVVPLFVATLVTACAGAQEQLGQGQRDQVRRQAADLSMRSVRHYQAGEYPQALKLQEQALKMRRSLYPPKEYPDGHPELAVSLNNLAAILRASGDYPKAKDLYQEALDMNQRLYPKKEYPHGHPDIASSLNNFGVLLRLTGNYAEALDKFRQALEMNQRLYPEPHPTLATSLNNLGDLLQEQGNYVEAKEYYAKALQMRRRLYPQGHPELAASLNNLASLLKDQADYAGALGYYQEALALNEKLFPRGHPDLVATINNLAGLHRALADYPVAKTEYQRALAMNVNLYPTAEYSRGHPALASSLNNLAALLQDIGDFEAARGYYEEALAMRRRLYPAERFPGGHPALAISLNNLGTLHRAIGDYVGARSYYEQALAMNRTIYPPTEYPRGHPFLATSLNNLGDLLHERGEYALAQSYYEQALALNRKLYPEAEYRHGYPDLATSLHNLGELQQDRGNFDAAKAYYEKALAMREQLYPVEKFPNGHPALAASLNNLGALSRTRRDYAAARRYYEQALAMNRTIYPPTEYPRGHPVLATSLNNLGDLLQSEGNYGDARRYFEDALELRKKLFPAERFSKGHPDLAASLNNLGDLLLAMGKFTEAQNLDEQALLMYQGLADTVTAASSEAEALNFTARLPVSRDGLLSATGHLRGTDNAAYAALWRTKAVIWSALQMRQAALRVASAHGEINELVNQLNDARLGLSRLMLNSAGGTPNYQEFIRKRTQDKETLEQKLAERVPEFKQQQALRKLNPADLAKVLPPNAVFVDFVQYVRSEQDRLVPGWKGEQHYPAFAAFVLRNNQPAVRVELGQEAREAKTSPGVGITLALAAWRVAIDQGIDGGPGGAEADALRRLVWAPLAPHIPPGTRTLYLAPDGALTRLPWAALPTAASGPVLLEKYAIAIVPHGPFLLERLAAPPRQPRPVGTLLAVGGVDYDHAPDPAPVQAGGGSSAVRRPAEPGGRRVWDQLPQSGPDLKKVLVLAKPRPTLSLQGTAAGAPRLLWELPRARWAYLSTHAFYADNELRRALQQQGRPFLRELSGERAAPEARNPLVLCGLALAGANLPPARNPDGVPVEDGLVTAEAVVGLPLDGLDLVVLAACHTALGEVAVGEGVFGLQRAFHLAGARDVVAAFWAVDDQATAALMALFHQLLWQNHRPPLEALRAAQLYLYRHPEQFSPLARPWDASYAEDLRDAAQQAIAEADRNIEGGELEKTKLWAGFALSGLGIQSLD